MLKTITLLLTIFLVSGCNSFQTKVICKQIKDYEIKPLPLCDVSFQFNRCRCRCFDYNKWTTYSDIKTCKNFEEEVAKKANKYSYFLNLILNTTRVVKLDVNGKVVEDYEAKDFPIEYCEGLAGFFLEDAAASIRPNIKALNEVKTNLCEKKK